MEDQRFRRETLRARRWIDLILIVAFLLSLMVSLLLHWHNSGLSVTVAMLMLLTSVINLWTLHKDKNPSLRTLTQEAKE